MSKKPYRKILRDNIQGISKGRLQKLCAKAGVSRRSGLLYEELRGMIKTFMQNVLRAAVTSAQYYGRKGLKIEDLLTALKVCNYKLALPLGLQKNQRRIKARTLKGCSTSHGKKKDGTKAKKRASTKMKDPQKSDCLVFAKAPFVRLSVEISQDYAHDVRFEMNFNPILQSVVEHYVVQQIRAARLVMEGEKRETLTHHHLQRAGRVASTARNMMDILLI